MTRERLPNRRRSENIRFKVGKTSYHATIGYFDESCTRPGELFLNCEKTGTDVQVYMRDFAIAISFALQHGAKLEDITKALCRLEDGTPASPVGQFLDLYVRGGR